MKPRRLPSGSWNVRIMIDGHTYSFTDSSKRAVMARATAFAAEHRENAVNPPLGKCLEDFIEDSRETLSPSTVRAYGGILRAIRRRNPTIANKRIVSLTNKDIQSIINPLRAPKTQRNYVNFIQVATSRKFTVKYKIREQKHIRVPTDLEVLGLVADQVPIGVIVHVRISGGNVLARSVRAGNALREGSVVRICGKSAYRQQGCHSQRQNYCKKNFFGRSHVFFSFSCKRYI